MLRVTAIIVLSFYLTTAAAQTYDHYFFSKIKADSLISKGDYIGAIPYLRVCISEPAMVTVRDEFNFGYAHFKKDSPDTAVLFMNKALTGGFYFHDVAQFKYWSDAGVFERFRNYPVLRGLDKMLERNTLAYVNRNIDSTLLNQLLEAREKDQRIRKDYSKQLPLDIDNQEFLNHFIEQYGWPTNDMVGGNGANAAFLIAQHADNDLNFQLECLGYIRDAYYREQVDPAYYAYIIDRTRVNSKRPQVFGSQYDQQIENKLNVDLRRRVFRLESLEEYLSRRR
ncbi:MAG TPA: DUF6624 domain-containing protein [Cyclobacteriaceae bacterium]|nr:DUF6624 domain-containing protein [Cyclobacteriaceae bacterium]